jgi:hypothetical protein
VWERPTTPIAGVRRGGIDNPGEHELVGMVVRSPATAGRVRLSSVFTRGQDRAKGYAAAMVAAITADSLKQTNVHGVILLVDSANEPARRLESIIAAMTIQQRAGIVALCMQMRQSLRQKQRACIGLGTINAVCIACERADIRAFKSQSERQEKLAVATTPPTLGTCHTTLATRDDRATLSFARDVARNACHDETDLARFAFDEITQHQRLVARLASDICCRIERSEARGDEMIFNARENGIARLGCFNKARRLNTKACANGCSFFARGGIRHSGAGCNAAQIITRHIGNDERYHARGITSRSQLPTFDG